MKRSALFVLSTFLPVASVIAHHSFIAQFDLRPSAGDIIRASTVWKRPVKTHKGEG